MDRFLGQRDEAAELAFALLVKRHGPMVLRVCRGVLADPNDADDAFQATFLVLARKAGAIRNRESVASYLHGVCLRAARDIHAAAARRKKREGAAARPSISEGRDEIIDAVHEIVARLPERYRDPIVLCELEGLSCDEAARRLGCPVGTIKSRLSRGRDRLRAQWSRGGLTSSLSFGSPIAVPAALAESTSLIARPFNRRATLEAVAERIIRAIAVSKLKIVAVSFIAVATTLAVGMTWVLGGPPKASPIREIAAVAPRDVRVDEAKAQEEDVEDLPGELTGPSRDDIEALIRKIGRDEPTPELVDQITSFFRPRVLQRTEHWEYLVRRVSEPSFVSRMDVLARELTGKPADTRNLICRASHDHIGRQDDLHRVEMRDDLSRQAEATKTLRGRVLDDRGKPIPEAVVSTWGAIARSDQAGQFTLHFKRSRTPFAKIFFEAKGYGLTEAIFLTDEVHAEDRYTYKLSKQKPCMGRVVDAADKPIAGVELDLWIARTAIVRYGSTDGGPSEGNAISLKVRSDDEGRFAFRGIPPLAQDGRLIMHLLATHPRYEKAEYHFNRNEQPRSDVDFTLRLGCTIMGTVRDDAGRPLADAWVRMESRPTNDFRSNISTDGEGRFRVANLSPGEWKVIAESNDQAMSWVSARANRENPVELNITAPAGGYISGRVIGPDGKPSANSAVGWLEPLNAAGRLSEQPRPARITHTQPDGSFRIGPVPIGRYKVLGLIEDPRSEAYAEGETGQTDLVIRHVLKTK
ncbi:sigma-70 family RNA polymerase sigma factor [Singulisphaera sp. PoT]|uniref:sigma-70 family RNA polymerase sigma factor n=1 Tax=Singulisphaera sp. PoT TaxID=3411797 RepID=UPI003BF4EB66